MILDPKQCVILVPANGFIEPACEAGLRELEARGYPVRRVRGYAAIDQARNQMASDALADGFEELMWIDSDIDFRPDDVERLRSHNLHICSGIYPKKNQRALATQMLPGVTSVVFGPAGGVMEVLYAAGGFLLTRRRVYFDIERYCALPRCNQMFERSLLPFFLPLLQPHQGGLWYLAEDYAFCERARQSGHQIWADTTIRLHHLGTYAFGWEDAGGELQRFDNYSLNLPGATAQGSAHPGMAMSGQAAGAPLEVTNESQEAGLAAIRVEHPWPDAPPQVRLRRDEGWLFSATKDMLASVLSSRTRLVVEVGSWLGLSSRFIADRAPAATIVAIDHWRGSPEHQGNPEFRELLPVLYETFLANCWEYRERIVPVRLDSIAGLSVVATHGLLPDVVYLDGNHGYEAVYADVQLVRRLFPAATLIGDDWNWEGVRTAVEQVARESGGRVGVHGVAWRFFPAAR